MDGTALAGLKPHEIRRKGIARTFQGERLFRDLAVIDNLEVTGVGLGQSRARARAEAAELLDWIGIGPLQTALRALCPIPMNAASPLVAR